MNKTLMVVALLSCMMMSACDKNREDLKSPCVGLEDSPCGPKRSVNDWWLA